MLISPQAACSLTYFIIFITVNVTFFKLSLTSYYLLLLAVVGMSLRAGFCLICPAEKDLNNQLKLPWKIKTWGNLCNVYFMCGIIMCRACQDCEKKCSKLLNMCSTVVSCLIYFVYINNTLQC